MIFHHIWATSNHGSKKRGGRTDTTDYIMVILVTNWTFLLELLLFYYLENIQYTIRNFFDNVYKAWWRERMWYYVRG